MHAIVKIGDNITNILLVLENINGEITPKKKSVVNT